MKSSSLLAGFGLGIALPLTLCPSPTTAAPDDTLGMAIMGAHVSAAGSLIPGSSGAKSAAKLGTGAYQIDFDRDVSNCLYAVTHHTNNGQTLAQPYTDPGSVYVATQLSDGLWYDSEFYLIVYCAR